MIELEKTPARLMSTLALAALGSLAACGGADGAAEAPTPAPSAGGETASETATSSGEVPTSEAGAATSTGANGDTSCGSGACT